jgi:DNA-binding XRE family transcriptional regulator
MDRETKKKRAERLREARLRAGYTSAAAAARQFRWTKPTYAGHENGSRTFSWEDAQRYAKAFKVEPLWLRQH